MSMGSSTVNKYYHKFKIFVLFGSLDKCKKDVISRFMKGLNSEIQTIHIHETYSYIGHLFLLARIAENQISLSSNTCMKNVTHDYQISSTPHANQEHKIVEHTAELPLSQGALLVDPCDKEELCDISLFTTSPQLDGEHTLVSCSAPNILQENEIQLALSEETIPKPSPTCENKNCIDEIPFVVCSAIFYFGQNKNDLATQPIEVESEKVSLFVLNSTM